MAKVVRPANTWERDATPAAMLLHHQEADWEFRELLYAPSGTWDVVTTRLHIAAHPDPLRQRLGGARIPLRTVAPSAAVSATGDRLAGAWEESGRGRHVMIAPGFVAAALGRDLGEACVLRRHFAYGRDCDSVDAVIANLMGALSAHLRAGSPGGTVFLETVVTALIQHVVRAPSAAAGEGAATGGLSRAQLGLALDMIDAHLLGRLSLVELASALDVSTRYFCRAFRRSTGQSPHQFILRRRVDLARALIEGGGLSLTQVAHAAGFSHHSQMTTTFRRVLGHPPSHFRNDRTHCD